MNNYIIIHGSFSNPFSNWFGWLFKTLEDGGEKVLVPQFPCRED